MRRARHAATSVNSLLPRAALGISETTWGRMDNIAAIILLFIVVLISAGIVLPIVALVLALNTKKKFDAQLARLSSTSSLNPDALQQIRTTDLAPLAKAIQQLDVRIGNIESTLA